jgi:hypothetical protein
MVEASGGLTRSKVQAGETVRLWFTIRNRTDKPLTNVTMSPAGMSGLAFTAHSWCPPPSPKSATPPANCEQLAALMPAGSSQTFWADMRASAEAAESPFLIVEYTQGNSAAREVVLLGKLEVQTQSGAILAVALELTKDLALPVILLLLGVFFQWKETERERRRKAEDRDREDREKEEEQRRESVRQKREREESHVRQTWNLMLPVSHKLATEHYVGIQQAARGLLEATAQREAALQSGRAEEAGQQARNAFHFFALFHRRVRHLSRTAGGFYFKHRTGEEILRTCHAQFLRRYAVNLGEARRQFGPLMDAIDVNETVASFENKLLSREPEHIQAFQAAWQSFEDWLGSGRYGPALECLRAFRAVLEYEMNRPYEHWYGRRERITATAGVQKTLFDLAREVESQNPGFEGEVQAYLEAAR